MQIEDTTSDPLNQAPLPQRPATSRAVKYAVQKANDIKLKRKLAYYISASLFVGFVLGAIAMHFRHNAEDSIAAVNGKVISKNDLFEAMANSIGPQTLHKLVEDQVQLQFAATKGLVPTDQQVQERYKQLKSQSNYDLILRNAHMVDNVYYDNLKLLMAQQAVFTQGVTVSDDEVQKFYQSQTNPNNPNSLFYRPPVSTLQVIATHTQADADSALTQINNGIPFDIVASKVSIDGTRVGGGRLNPLMFGQNPLSRFPDIERTVFDLRVGQITQPLYFGRAYWIFKCNEYAPPVTIPFSQVAAEARQEALVAKGVQINSAQLKQDFSAFMKNSKIQTFWQGYAAAVGG